MTLPSNYLEYPNRQYGMDHRHYPWSILPRRPRITWPGDAPIALWVVPALEYFPLNPRSQAIRLPGSMITPYPDLRNFTLRDYGNRVGVYRLLEVLDRLSLRASFAVNAAICTRFPALVGTILQRGDELIGHGLDMDHPHDGELPLPVERRQLADALAVIRAAAPHRVIGWLSPGRSESSHTPALLAEAGIQYFCDWVNDDMPYRFETESGPLIAMPHSPDLDDRQCMVEFCQAEQDFSQQILDHYRFLKREAETQGGRILSISLHPWVAGQPHRIGCLEEALTSICREGAVWSATGAEIFEQWRRQQP